MTTGQEPFGLGGLKGCHSKKKAGGVIGERGGGSSEFISQNRLKRQERISIHTDYHPMFRLIKLQVSLQE